MFNFSHKYILSILFFIIFCYIALVFVLNSISFSSSLDSNTDIDFIVTDSSFLWPTPGYYTITSPFGYRNAPTSGAGKFHGGIDIGAPTGAKILAAFSGEVTYIGFLRC